MSDELGGMTVNERLWHCGLLDSFDAAIKEKNRSEAISILEATSLPTLAATETVDAIIGRLSSDGLD